MWCIQNHRITYFFKKFLTTSVLILNFVYLVICETKSILKPETLTKYTKLP